VSTVVIGVGNPLRGDDAVGLHVLRGLRERLGPTPDIDLVELWVGGLRLAEAMGGYARAVVVDALVEAGAEPGSIRRLDVADLAAARHLACAHDTSLPTALEAWRVLGLEMPEVLTIWGVVAADTETLTERLSPLVAAAVPRLIRVLAGELTGAA
jgi:hydrogenase maturation protease